MKVKALVLAVALVAASAYGQDEGSALNFKTAQNVIVDPNASYTWTLDQTFAGKVLINDGTVAAPELAFASTPTLGWYKLDANYWALGAGGTARFAAGTGGTRALTYGIGTPTGATTSWIENGAGGANEIAFYTNSGLRWTLNATGNLYPDASTQTLGTSAKPVGSTFLASAATLQFSTDVILQREAAGHLSLRNGANPQMFSVANNFTDPSNYERGGFRWVSNNLEVYTTNAGTGSTRNIYLNSSSGNTITLSLFPATTDTRNLGLSTNAYQSAHLTRSIQGSKSKVLVAGVATEFDRVSIPQTAGSNYAAGEIIWTVFFADATDQQVLQGRTAFSCFNKAGTEDCSLVAVYTPTLAASAGAAKDDLACTIADVNGLTDAVGFSANCTSTEMTETTLTIQFRLDMPPPNTVTPQ